jgi:hypothetical protein
MSWLIILQKQEKKQNTTRRWNVFSAEEQEGHKSSAVYFKIMSNKTQIKLITTEILVMKQI